MGTGAEVTREDGAPDSPRSRIDELLAQYVAVFPGRSGESEKYLRPLFVEVVGMIGPQAFRNACLRAREEEGEFVGLARIVALLQFPPNEGSDKYLVGDSRNWRQIVAAARAELGSAAAADLPHASAESHDDTQVSGFHRALPPAGAESHGDDVLYGEEMRAHEEKLKRKYMPWSQHGESADERTRRLAREALEKIAAQRQEVAR